MKNVCTIHSFVHQGFAHTKTPLLRHNCLKHVRSWPVYSPEWKAIFDLPSSVHCQTGHDLTWFKTIVVEWRCFVVCEGDIKYRWSYFTLFYWQVKATTPGPQEVYQHSPIQCCFIVMHICIKPSQTLVCDWYYQVNYFVASWCFLVNKNDFSIRQMSSEWFPSNLKMQILTCSRTGGSAVSFL